MQVARRHPYLTAAAVIAAVAAAVAFYAWADPRTVPLPQCVFRQLTGWECPGCGIQRSLHAALHGQWAEAWAYNRLAPFLLAAAAAYGSGPLWRRRWPRLWWHLTGRQACLTVFAAVVGWTILRNIL